MKKIINKKKIKTSFIGLSLLALVGCSKIEPDTVVPKKIDGINISSIDNNEVVYFDELKDVNVYLDYSVSDDNVYYGSSLLKEVEGEGYTAYYAYKSGNLVGIVFNKDISDKDKFLYRDYLKEDYIKISTLEDQLYNPNNIKLIQDGINYDLEYIDYDSLRLMDASIIPHNKEAFKEEIDTIYKEKKLTR